MEIESAGKIINQMEKNESARSTLPAFFSLSRLKPHCHYPPVTVDFTKPFPTSSQLALFPVYNNDSKHSTPSFLLPSQKSSSDNYVSSEQEKFFKMKTEEEFLEKSIVKEDEIYRRGSQSKYCQICKQKFDDYWMHLSHKNHQRKVQYSEFNKDIAKLCKQFNQGIQRQTAPQHSRKSRGKKDSKITIQQKVIQPTANPLTRNQEIQLLRC